MYLRAFSNRNFGDFYYTLPRQNRFRSLEIPEKKIKHKYLKVMSISLLKNIVQNVSLLILQVI